MAVGCSLSILVYALAGFELEPGVWGPLPWPHVLDDLFLVADESVNIIFYLYFLICSAPCWLSIFGGFIGSAIAAAIYGLDVRKSTNKPPPPE